ncbi:hypothetical protein V5F23_16965 [Pseudomonas sp. WP18]
MFRSAIEGGGLGRQPDHLEAIVLFQFARVGYEELNVFLFQVH